MIDDLKRKDRELSGLMDPKELKLKKFRIWDTFQMKKWGEYEDPRFLHYNFPYRSLGDLVTWYFYKKGMPLERFLYAAYAGKRMVGYVILKNVDHLACEGEMGISFDVNILDNGYGTEAVKQFLDICFKRLEVRRITLKTAAFNARAIRCYEKAGFKEYMRNDDVFEEQSYADQIAGSYDGFTMSGDKLMTEYVFMEAVSPYGMQMVAI
jgi:diamine N-acetyltransferase